MSSERKRLTLFHELAHIVLDFAEDADVEKLCHIFAGEVLLQSSVLKRLVGDKRKHISLVELQDIQRIYGISIEAIMAKAHQLSIISDNEYRGFNIRLRTSTKFNDEVRKSTFPKEYSARFERLVYKALSDELISVSKAANLLNSSVDEVLDRINVA